MTDTTSPTDTTLPTDTSVPDTTVPNFPVEWENPDDANRRWIFASRNYPDQVYPLEFDFIRSLMDSMAAAARQSGFAGVGGTRRINTFVYIEPPSQGDTDSPASLRTAMVELGELWEHEYLPEINGYLEEMAEIAPERLSDADLADRFETVSRYVTRLFELHFQILLPAREAMTAFEETYRDLVGGSALDAHILLGGFPTKTSECTIALWRLSRVAAASREVRETLETEPSGNVLAALHEQPAARPFIDALDEFLRDYGHRTDGTVLHRPSWLEDPTPVFATIKGYLSQPDTAGPERALERAAHERESAVHQARERIASYPGAVVEEFETLLAAAQTGSRLSEENTHYINVRGFYEARRMIRGVGTRLAGKDIIAEPGDVFCLTAGEVHSALADGETAGLRERIAERNAEMTRWAGVRPPDFLGTAASGAGTADRSGTDGTVTGTAGSPGTARGVARVIRTLADADRLRLGEILVTEMTQPSWTPLFTVAAAVVVDTGGVLNHAAIAARESAIPAVVGAGNATANIHDGQVVEVDGAAGTVRAVG